MLANLCKLLDTGAYKGTEGKRKWMQKSEKGDEFELPDWSEEGVTEYRRDNRRKTTCPVFEKAPYKLCG